jgi:hypothetical protein
MQGVSSASKVLETSAVVGGKLRLRYPYLLLRDPAHIPSISYHSFIVLFSWDTFALSRNPQVGSELSLGILN